MDVGPWTDAQSSPAGLRRQTTNAAAAAHWTSLIGSVASSGRTFAGEKQIGEETAELGQIVAQTRERTSVLLKALNCSKVRFDASSEMLLDLVAKVELEFQAVQVARDAALASEKEVAKLRERVDVLNLEEAERRGGSKGCLPSSCNDLEPGSFPTSTELKLLKADLRDDELLLFDLQQQCAALGCSADHPSSCPDERQFFEWYSMLVEDDPEHVAMAIIESECDAWEHRLHELLAPVAFPSSNAELGEGVDRLVTEIESIGASERGQKAGCAECLHRLARESTPWSPAISKLREAYDSVEALRTSGDYFAGEIVAVRWKRVGSSPASIVSTPPVPLKAKEVVTQPNLPIGPRFSTPLSSQLPTPAADEQAKTAMPQAVVTDAKEWEIGAQSIPVEQGLSYLCGTSAQRFRPGTVVSSGFETSLWGDDPPQESGKKTVDMNDLTRWASAAFREPLSAALGTGKGSPRKAKTAQGDRSRPRWITFDSSPGQQSRQGDAASPNESSFLPISPISASGTHYNSPIDGRCLDPAPASLFPPKSQRKNAGDWTSFGTVAEERPTAAYSERSVDARFEGDRFGGNTFDSNHRGR